MRRVLIAFDKFKNSLSAPEACAIAAERIAGRFPDWKIECCPLADGGEGFGSILTNNLGGPWVEHEVTGPRGARVRAGFGLVPIRKIPGPVLAMLGLNPDSDGELGIVEMPLASGLAQLPLAQRDPWLTQSTGTGELLVAAADAGAEALLLGIGGSATNDIGLGALQAMGLKALDASGNSVVPASPSEWYRVEKIGGKIRENFPQLFIACDVANPLLGARGCSTVFGPQKGLGHADLPRMEALVTRVSGMLCESFGQPLTVRDVPGTGAAGGIAFGLLCAVGAQLVPGTDLVFEWMDLDRRIQDVDIVITGEGRFDASSLNGKGPGALAELAAAKGKEVFVLPGSLEEGIAATVHFTILPITPEGIELAEALDRAPELLGKTMDSIIFQNGPNK